ncbi:putative phosphoglycerate mutase [Kitasatospora sp. GP30]|uniref:histidine phosphatase family protein n=1 Tax=Kitasatospora sp. GP30 TaxID=3035084 RepID=UPI000C70192D|nr:histidine phosphatase family protein [Kitasatospora sp. GP30]MDH6138475.1 putative phosphoglycerate mutase [Kitasatospora sp. GP30]
MTTYLLRHGRTSYSAEYRVNGDPRIGVALDSEGVAACRRAHRELPIADLRSCVVSAFPRTAQTARLLLGKAVTPLVVDARLNELDYGAFEGRPFLEYGAWLRESGASRRPDGGQESQLEGISRMLRGVQACLELPGPRLIVGHGLLISVLSWQLSRTEEPVMPPLFPEAPYLRPLAVTDAELGSMATLLLNEIRGAKWQ